MEQRSYRSGISATYWLVSAAILILGGIYFAIAVSVIGGIVLIAIGALAVWAGTRSTRAV